MVVGVLGYQLFPKGIEFAFIQNKNPPAKIGGILPSKRIRIILSEHALP